MTWQVEYLNATCDDKDITSITLLLHQLTDRRLDQSKTTLRNVLSDNIVVVVRNESKSIIGMATLKWSQKLTGFKANIDDVVVDQEYRRRGIARAMILHLISLARRNNILHISLTSNPKRKNANLLYLSLDFELYRTNVYRLTLSEN